MKLQSRCLTISENYPRADGGGEVQSEGERKDDEEEDSDEEDVWASMATVGENTRTGNSRNERKRAKPFVLTSACTQELNAKTVDCRMSLLSVFSHSVEGVGQRRARGRRDSPPVSKRGRPDNSPSQQASKLSRRSSSKS